MKGKSVLTLIPLGLTLAFPLAAKDDKDKEVPKVAIPQAGVPQIMTMEGRFIRAAYNNEGYAILGYRVANLSVGQKWMLLEIGFTVRDGQPTYTMTRDALTLETPDGLTIPMASNEDYRGAALAGLDKMAQDQHDSINYFPPQARSACRIGYFSDLAHPGKSYDQVEVNSQRACMGRIYFQVPAGITYGQHWLNVKFAKSLVRVPFRILTEEEYKFLDKNYKNIEKQVEEAFRKNKR